MLAYSMMRITVLALAAAIGASHSCAAQDLEEFYSPRAAATSSAATTLFRHGPAQWQLVTDPARSGIHSQRFQVAAGDCSGDPNWDDCATDRERMEAVVDRHLQLGDDAWIAWSIYLPDDFPDITPTQTSLGQIGQIGGPRGTDRGMPSVPPLLQFTAEDTTYNCVWHQLSGSRTAVRVSDQRLVLTTLAEMRGHWTDLLLHISLSKAHGHAEIWVNGEQRAAITDQLITMDVDSWVFKYGIYRSFVSRYQHKYGSSVPTQIAYFDEVRIGSSRDQVDPRSAVAPPPVD